MTEMKELVKKYLPRSVIRVAASAYYKLKPDASIERFVAHNRVRWSEQPTKPDGLIIFDAYPYAQSLVTMAYFLNVLAKKLNARFRPFSSKGVNNPAYMRLYRSFGGGDEIVTKLDASLVEQANTTSNELFRTLKTKEDLIALKILGYDVGIDVYETYLRFNGKPTVSFDADLERVLRETVHLVYFWEKVFREENVKAVVVSHTCYNHLNVPAKIAYKKGLPVYLPYARGMSRPYKSFDLYSFFPKFREMFRRMPEAEREKALKLAKSQIDRRLSGEVGVDMPYSTKSAFGAPDKSKRILPQNDKIKILIASHCFYDNPYAYGDMLFVDFYEWIAYLGKLAEETDYEWFLKMHPDPMPGTEDAMKALLSKYPRIRMLPNGTSHRQLASEGLNFVLTVYGTVGFEYPALGVQVINAGYNPRVAYSYNWHPKTVAEYREMLLNLEKLNLKVNQDEYYESYYMLYYYIYADDNIFPDYTEAERAVGGYHGLSEPKTYDYFLSTLTPERDAKIIARMSEFIDSGSKFCFSQGPEKFQD